MEHAQTSTVIKQFKRSADEDTLNALGKASRWCRRERTVTPFHLALSLIDAFATSTLNSIADLQRAFNCPVRGYGSVLALPPPVSV